MIKLSFVVLIKINIRLDNDKILKEERVLIIKLSRVNICIIKIIITAINNGLSQEIKIEDFCFMKTYKKINKRNIKFK